MAQTDAIVLDVWGLSAVPRSPFGSTRALTWVNAQFSIKGARCRRLPLSFHLENGGLIEYCSPVMCSAIEINYCARGIRKDTITDSRSI